MQETRKLHDTENPINLSDLWYDRATDPFAKATITGTAALALWTLKAADTPAGAQRMACALWEERHQIESRSA
jgi:hypothetical protein